MKLMYRTTECTFIEWLSALLATTIQDEATTLVYIERLLRAKRNGNLDEYLMQFGGDFANLTGFQCSVML